MHFRLLVTLIQYQHAESVQRPLPPSSRENRQVDDAICGLEAGHKNGPIVRTEALYYHGPPYKCKWTARARTLCVLRNLLLAQCWPRGHQLSRKSLLGFYLFTLGSSGGHRVLQENLWSLLHCLVCGAFRSSKQSSWILFKPFSDNFLFIFDHFYAQQNFYARLYLDVFSIWCVDPLMSSYVLINKLVSDKLLSLLRTAKLLRTALFGCI